MPLRDGTPPPAPAAESLTLSAVAQAERRRQSWPPPAVYLKRLRHFAYSR